MPERIDDPSFKMNDEAINKVYGQDDFSFGGHIYHKSEGETYREYGEIPEATVRIAPDEAARINAQRLESDVSNQKRQAYLKKREEWHNTPDTPSMGPEFDHRHDAPPPHPDVKPVADSATDFLHGYMGGEIAKGVGNAVKIGSKMLRLPDRYAQGLAYAASSWADSLSHDGWHYMNPHKDQ
ncbi:hypothetical protein NNJEOMEG_03875 [Fundidesulfovibrio magnetotacticus]|uniref:Uncharacterized protein n=1 Tax=Fundidesulfovibrio magnetotacticus TaxID=2730080 RepID=A0A6V8LZM6_9BACT|nr:hypothetical protein [Fundidesulfovibrio magnetotacticus]GFK96001.1 hypothetical protein NNJEOMEG_03875 [Fundidesulfovibrio magnetotacticus]